MTKYVSSRPVRFVTRAFCCPLLPTALLRKLTISNRMIRFITLEAILRIQLFIKWILLQVFIDLAQVSIVYNYYILSFRADSGFRRVEVKKYTPRLLHVFGEKVLCLKCMTVPYDFISFKHHYFC